MTKVINLFYLDMFFVNFFQKNDFPQLNKG
jgi:hypothetical protein